MVAALSAGMAIRGLILGWPSATGLSATYFPAYIIATLYGGPRWGWASLAISMTLGVLTPNALSGGVPAEAVMLVFALSGALTVLVAATLRETLLRYEEARETKQAFRAALKESETRLRLAQEAGSVGLWDWDLSTDQLTWSPTIYRNLGLPAGSPPALAAALDATHPADRGAVRAYLAKARDGHIDTLEYRVVWPDGSVRWLLSRGDILRDGEGRIERAVGVNIDITERRRADEQLQESEARFRSLADSAPVLMWISGPDNRREFVNQAYLDFLGVDLKAALEGYFLERVHPDDRDRVRREAAEAFARGDRGSIEARYRRSDGEWRWLHSVSQARLNSLGERVGSIGIAYDVTEARQAQADLTRINELLAERVREALAERDEAEAALGHAQRLEAVGQLTGGVAHDFNNLLTVIIGALDLMQRHPDDSSRRERMVEAALGAARRGERLTQQLLAFSRRQTLRPEPVDIDAAVIEAEPLLRRAVGEAVHMTMAPTAGGAVAMIDASQFHAALMNLVVNARDAVAQGGDIRVETAVCELAEGEAPEIPSGPYVRLTVSDTGIGMDAAILSRVFEPFFTTKEVGKGTGLGLSQVYGFARQSGGGVSIQSAPEAGASVRLFLPVSAAVAPPARTAEAAPAQSGGPGFSILLVEDDPEVAEMVAAMLTALGHRVTHADGVEAALARLGGEAAIDLMLTDLIMPGSLTGVDLARQATALRPGLPVVLASGYTGDALAAADGAPWPLLRKPFSSDVLARMIAEVLQGERETS